MTSSMSGSEAGGVLTTSSICKQVSLLTMRFILTGASFLMKLRLTLKADILVVS
ncbi:hypothetical protein QTJ16_003109 [Diplocarpon rosae]|uniref:Uncharacterized protein n=1 Tax=Diplocarpon rosae TaxID=946125 RepID=A0AAD9SZ14_9HELO|nr:hypothetical protein QTJ16_003109 [Diplocarpon rosae]